MKKALWTGRILSGLVVLFLAFDAAVKLLEVPAAVEATSKFGFPPGTLFTLGIIQLGCLIVYLIPRTAVLGAVLWTGYLGGAIATHLRTGGPAFSLVFPLIVAALLWGGLWLRDSRTRAVLAPRKFQPAQSL
jgi:DoxX-like family